MTRIDELIELIYEQQKEKERQECFLNKVKFNIDMIDKSISEAKAELLSLIDTDEAIYCSKDENKLVRRFHKASTGYTDEKAVIEWLKSNSKTDLLRIKTTEALDKNAIKKQLKTDVTLQEGLKPFILSGTTDYVIVTDKQNYEIMLEHAKEEK